MEGDILQGHSWTRVAHGWRQVARCPRFPDSLSADTIRVGAACWQHVSSRLVAVALPFGSASRERNSAQGGGVHASDATLRRSPARLPETWAKRQRTRTGRGRTIKFEETDADRTREWPFPLSLLSCGPPIGSAGATRRCFGAGWT
eukprot:gene16242-biopygen14316